MPERYPLYDVLAKFDSPSWNDKTREVVAKRLAIPNHARYLSEEEFATLAALAERITPQPTSRPPIPVAALVDEKLLEDKGDGFRGAGMPRVREAWKRGLGALDVEARASHGRAFHELAPHERDVLIRRMQSGELASSAWGGMPVKTFFQERVLNDICSAYYSHPTAWSEIGFGGPAAPRGYVRMGYDGMDPWDAAEARAGDEEQARRHNLKVGHDLDPRHVFSVRAR
ncbi:MAG TPA: gluconate 2-dehydrogenase subunit 3 family protein [Steroidobacteraceae bacterium]|nr:gluconate 2-dehydrogenase subunit 3 family protein [Steroidobacteraceae bacterium]